MWINDQRRQGCLHESSVYLTERLFYYAQVELLYIRRSSQLVKLLQNHVTDIYVSILEYASQLKVINNEGKIGK